MSNSPLTRSSAVPGAGSATLMRIGSSVEAWATAQTVGPRSDRNNF
jgi:hypothetical protein